MYFDNHGMDQRRPSGMIRDYPEGPVCVLCDSYPAFFLFNVPNKVCMSYRQGEIEIDQRRGGVALLHCSPLNIQPRLNI